MLKLAYDNVELQKFSGGKTPEPPITGRGIMLGGFASRLQGGWTPLSSSKMRSFLFYSEVEFLFRMYRQQEDDV